ncbi:MAG: hypothetical protein Q4D62_04395 [Planctomycetia bacterium]|nr:hypothetical protein [Planctomycetia bacterium]
MTDLDKQSSVEFLAAYCEEYNVPIHFLREILTDQKVIPMIRGKAMEYNAFLRLKDILPKNTWSVQKLNLNAQPGYYDEDIGIVHRRTGTLLKVESKSAMRGSFTSGKRCKIMRDVPHFKIKCHRSRSNIQLLETSNDRYSVDSFDLLLSTPENSLYKKGSISEHFEICTSPDLQKILYGYYRVNDEKDLILASRNDWRFAIPNTIAENGYIPRTPYVQLSHDPHWHPMRELEPCLLEIVKEKRKNASASRR